MNNTGKIKVHVIDDSAVIRQVLSQIIMSDSELELAGASADPIFAMRRMENNWPDVIILDIEMPRMDGLTFLKKIMLERPTPVIMCSVFSSKGAETILQALSLGAMDVITKPQMGAKGFLNSEAASLLTVIKAAAEAKIEPGSSSGKREIKEQPPNVIGRMETSPKLSADVMLSPPTKSAMQDAIATDHIVVIGASTGGTQALEQVLMQLPKNSPGIVIVQHMPEKFTEAFANRLNKLCLLDIKEARDGDQVLTGRVLIAPGGQHTMVKRKGRHYYVEVTSGPLVSRHRPSVDVLFRSAAKSAGMNAIGIIMTGMGDDGANGLLEMHQSGAITFAQDEDSCVVYGMPREAVKNGAVDHVIPLSRIHEIIEKFGIQE